MNKYKGLFWCLLILTNLSLFGQPPVDPLCIPAREKLYAIDFRNQPEAAIVAIQKLNPELVDRQCWDTYADAFNLLSVAYYYKRNYRAAKENAQKAMEVCEQYLGKTLKYAAAIANLSLFVDYDTSVKLQKESLKIEEQLGSEYEALVYALEGLGLTYQDIGDYDTAIEYLREAIEMVKENTSQASHEEARLLRQMATCYQAKNKETEALEILKEAILILDQLPAEKYYEQTRWYAYCDVAKIYSQQGNLPQAKKYIAQAMLLQKEEELLEQYQSWLIKGDIYLKEGKEAKALSSYLQAQRDAEQEFHQYEDHLALAKPLAATASVFVKKKDHRKALSYFNKALERLAIDFSLQEPLQNPPANALINKFMALQLLKEKAQVLEAFYQEEGEWSLLQAAHQSNLLSVQLIQDIRETYLAEGSKHTLIEKTHDLHSKAIGIALECYQERKELQYLEEAFVFAESNKAVLLYESIKDKVAKSSAALPDSLLQVERSLRSELAFYETMIVREKQKKISLREEALPEWERIVFKLKNKQQEQQQKIEKEYPLYRTLKEQTEPLALSDLQERLPDDETALVEFVIGAEQGYVFFLTKKGQNIFSIPGRADLQKEVDQFCHLLSAPPQEAEKFKADYLGFSQVANSLYEQLLHKGLEALPAEVEQLIIIPDDLLNYLPFELLTQQQPAEQPHPLFYKSLPYLFKDYTISYHYSASLTSLAVTPRATSFIGFAPSFQGGNHMASRSCQNNDLSALFCNAEEVQAIQNVLGGLAYTGAEATATTFAAEAPEHGIIHLATHACIHEKEMVLNKIFFADEEHLVQKQLDQIDLQASLTVLSACNTGRGKLLKGEGVMSLARCFLLAGSQSVLTSLWAVDDCSTSEIMIQYYRNLKAGSTKNQAIAQAKLNYLETADLNNSHPYYWAPFVQFGNVEPLFPSSSAAYWPYLLGALLGLFLLMGFWKSHHARS